jgi:hypothetical protein
MRLLASSWIVPGGWSGRNSPLHCVSGPELTRQALAWRYGTVTGLEVLRAEWDPGAEVADATELMKAARTALRDAAGEPARVTRNWVTAGRLQLRLGRDLLWYPYARSAGE